MFQKFKILASRSSDFDNPYINMWRNRIRSTLAKAPFSPALGLGRFWNRRGADTQLSLRTSCLQCGLSFKRQANSWLIPPSPLLQLRCPSRTTRLQPLFSRNLGYRLFKSEGEDRYCRARSHVREWSAYFLLCLLSFSFGSCPSLFSRHKY